MIFVPLSLPGLMLIKPQAFEDDRGLFIKTYQNDLFLRQGIDFDCKENFYSVSGVNVVRGMHFQTPPAQYKKLINCLQGRAYEVALDMRKGSPTYGQCWSGEINSIGRESIFFPPGIAHGFCALEPDTTIMYSVSHRHVPGNDHGVRWNSFNHSWPCIDPILSERDEALPSFQEYSSPFIYS